MVGIGSEVIRRRRLENNKPPEAHLDLSDLTAASRINTTQSVNEPHTNVRLLLSYSQVLRGSGEAIEKFPTLKKLWFGDGCFEARYSPARSTAE